MSAATKSKIAAAEIDAAVTKALGPPAAQSPALKLYQIPAAFEQLQNLIDEAVADGEITEDDSKEIARQFDVLEGTLHERVEYLCRIIKMRERTAEAREAQAAIIAEESRRLKKLATTDANIAERFKAYIFGTLTKMNLPKVETENFKVRIQNNSSPSIKPLCHVDFLPEEYRRVTTEPDLEAARATLKRGEQLPTQACPTCGDPKIAGGDSSCGQCKGRGVVELFEVTRGKHLRIS